MKVYTECTIKQHHAGFDMFERGELSVSPDTSYEDLANLVYESELTPLADALNDPEFQAAGIEDIRGRIYNEPAHIYVSLVDDDANDPKVIYRGVEESEVAQDFFE